MIMIGILGKTMECFASILLGVLLYEENILKEIVSVRVIGLVSKFFIITNLALSVTV